MESITINMRSDLLKREYEHLRRATSIVEGTRDVMRYSAMAWKSAVYSIVKYMRCVMKYVLNKM